MHRNAMAEIRLFIYFCCATLPAMLLTGMYTSPGDFSAGAVSNKVIAYRARANDFDTIFIGDSRTYCGIHPHRLDSLLSIESVNLASWAHWLPTQYAQFVDVIDYIPADTTVVWSVGLQNFGLCAGCTTLAYPIGQRNAQLYAELGLPKEVYAENVRKLKPVDQINRASRSRVPALYDELAQWFEVPLSITHNPGTAVESVSVQQRLERIQAQRDVANAAIRYQQQLPTSIEARFKHGGYERVELAPAFFRSQQDAHARRAQQNAQRQKAAGKSGVREISPAYLALFEAGLDLLASRNIRVIVNVLEEAPHTYGSREVHLASRHLMDTVVRDAVIARGYDYIRIDFDQLTSAHYFDYNHLNSIGAARFNDLFAARLRKANVGSMPLGKDS